MATPKRGLDAEDRIDTAYRNERAEAARAAWIAAMEAEFAAGTNGDECALAWGAAWNDDDVLVAPAEAV